MARSNGVTITVRVPINWDAMTKRTRQRLRQTVGRDTRVIRAYLGIIEEHEPVLLVGRNKDCIDESELDRMTMTALKVKEGTSQRISVLHDFKVRFPRISVNEMQECRQTAVALYQSYLKLRAKKGRKASRPTTTSCCRRIPRWVFSRRFKIIEKRSSASRWWLDVRDSLDSVREGRIHHDRLRVPLRISPYHLNKIRRGEVKALQIFTDKDRKWWVSLAVRMSIDELQEHDYPVAILGIDLGIEKSACCSLLTPEKVRETRFFVQKEKANAIRKYDRLVADLQREMHNRQNNGVECDGVAKTLRRMRSKRENVAKEYDRVLVRQILEYISEISERYTLYIAIGRLTNIRMRAKRGNYRGRKYRGMIHSWAFARITESLRHALAQKGWKVDGKDSRFRAVPETWTSVICWKCGSRGTRPKQNYFHCPSCGHKTNADRNGSINIAARMLTLTKSLHSVRGLGKWESAIARSLQPKAREKPSHGKSLLSKKGLSLGPGESAAVHLAQMSLTSFSDGGGVGDDDPAVGRTAETLTVAGSDVPASGQEKEARSVGGIPSR